MDLLARDDSLSPEARDYVTILNQKTERLKNTIADLFELAKSTSGEAKVTLEPMDLKKLMEQTLEDMSDQIRESGFKVKFQCDAEHTKFKGDVNRFTANCRGEFKIEIDGDQFKAMILFPILP